LGGHGVALTGDEAAARHHAGALEGNDDVDVPHGVDPGTLVRMSDLERMPVTTIPKVEEDTETGEPSVAHIVKVGPGETAAAKVLEARIYGTPIEALCGHVWVPSRDPRQLPVCQACKEVYDMFKIFNDGLNDSPTD
jgi:hypothetical protein